MARTWPRSQFPFLPRWLVGGGSVSLALLSGICGLSLHGAQGHTAWGCQGAWDLTAQENLVTCAVHPPRHPTEPSSLDRCGLGPHLVGDQQPAHPPRGAGRLSPAQAALTLKGSCTDIWGSHMCPSPHQKPPGCPLHSPGISGRRGRCPTLASGR